MDKETAALLQPILDKHPPEVIICLVAELLGWDLAIPGDPDEPCHGIIIGNSKFIQGIVDSLMFHQQKADMDNMSYLSHDDSKKYIN